MAIISSNQHSRISRGLVISFLIFAAVMTVLAITSFASSGITSYEPRVDDLQGRATINEDSSASNSSYLKFDSGGAFSKTDYALNLEKIRAQPWRNKNEDNSVYRDQTMQQLDAQVGSLLNQSRTAYNDGGFAEQYFTDTRPFPWDVSKPGLSAMRTGCEFSHFAYDDPIVFPDQPEAAHLHMFFGNTDANAYTTYDTLNNSGGGTCNGGELNRTGYWIPAMFDGRGSVVVPDFLNIYYKNDGLRIQQGGVGKNGGTIDKFVPAEAFPVAAEDTWIKDSFKGERIPNFQGVQIVTRETQVDTSRRKQPLWRCIRENGNVKGLPYTSTLNISISCPPSPSSGLKSYLEMHVYFPTCWNGQDPSDWQSDNVGLADGGFYWRDCDKAGYDKQFSGIQYRVRYTVQPGDNTKNWFIASDVNKGGNTKTVPNGSSTHGDWWGAWNPTVNQMWIDNCGNTSDTACGYGYMDGKPLDKSANGPTLRYREKYKGPQRIPVQDVYDALCSKSKNIQRDEQAAYCGN